MRLLTILFAVYISSLTPSVLAQPFLVSPLECGDASCNFKYGQGVYTTGIMNSVMDHSMKQNPSGAWPYGKTSNAGGDGVVTAFNGERALGAVKASDVTCISGSILLRPSPTSPTSSAMTNQSGCGTGYASYDEHPGYDYRASLGTPVKASANGVIVNIGGQRCFVGNMGGTCVGWGMIGIDHGNGYISQYAHLSRVDLNIGATVRAGQVIGLTGSTGLPSGPHLHFEVLKKIGTTYYYVDPYGWVGPSGADPLYSAAAAPPMKLWK